MFDKSLDEAIKEVDEIFEETITEEEEWDCEM